MVKEHVQTCKFCQEHNKQAVKYSKFNFEAEPDTHEIHIYGLDR